MVLIINQWTGRLTNNILQIIRAIHYAKIENHSVIIFKNNNYFKSNQITLNKSKNNTNIFNTFFNIKTMGCEDPSPLLMKEYFNTYIFNIMNFKFERNIESNDNIQDIIPIPSTDINIFAIKSNPTRKDKGLSYCYCRKYWNE